MKTRNILQRLVVLLALAGTAHVAFGATHRPLGKRFLQEVNCAKTVGDAHSWACNACTSGDVVPGTGCQTCVINRASASQEWMCPQICYNKQYVLSEAQGNNCSSCVAHAVDKVQCTECMKAGKALATKSNLTLEDSNVQKAVQRCLEAVQDDQLSQQYEYVNCMNFMPDAATALQCMACLYNKTVPSYSCLSGVFTVPAPEPSTPTPEPSTPTPEPSTTTPEPSTPTPEPSTEVGSGTCYTKYPEWFNQQCCALANGNAGVLSKCKDCSAKAVNAEWACIKCTSSPFTGAHEECHSCVVREVGPKGGRQEWMCHACMDSSKTEAKAVECLQALKPKAA